jgi:hypothetical protein
MTDLAPAAPPAASGPLPRRSATVRPRRLPGWVPSWALIATKNLELRKRRGLMIAVVLLTLAPPVVVLGIRLLFHAFDPKSYGPAGSPGLFVTMINPMAEFGFIVAAALGASAGTTDLTDGMFRHLVITGRSRVALYFARIPAGLSIIVPPVAVAFTFLCLVTSYAGSAPPSQASVGLNGASVPAHLDESQLRVWTQRHPAQAMVAFPASGPGVSSRRQLTAIAADLPAVYRAYIEQEATSSDPAVNEMIKVGLWLELEIGIGFVVGLGLGSLTGQRTITTVGLIAVEIILTPIMAGHVIPYFLDGQRLIVGVAMDQLRPAALGSGHSGGLLLNGGGSLQIPPMPTWAMVAVIVGWIVGWTGIGAWRMATRDA